MRNWRHSAALLAAGRLVIGLCGAVLLAQTATAAPERLGDNVPDATPDPEGAWSVSWAYENLALEGPLADSSLGNSYYKLRYQFSPDVNAAVFYHTHSLGGDLGLTSPLLDGADSASGYGVDLGINLLDVDAIPANPDAQLEWAAGSSFGVGLTLERLNLSLDNLDQEDSLMRAYLVYSTDLSEKLRAHTYFSTGRVSGDSHTGSWNRVSGGLDYALTDGERPLTLMANAILDIYNFRRPTFNTSRISRFDVGLRYEFQPGVNASLGWATLNDSENDASGSGLFASLQYTDLPSQRKSHDGEELLVEIPAPAVEPGQAASPTGPPPAEAAPLVADPVAAPPVAEAEPQPVLAPAVEAPTQPQPAPVEGPVITLPDARADARDARSVSSADAGADTPAYSQPPLMSVEPVVAADPSLTLDDEQVDQTTTSAARMPAQEPLPVSSSSLPDTANPQQTVSPGVSRVSSRVIDSLANEFAEAPVEHEKQLEQTEGDQVPADDAEEDLSEEIERTETASVPAPVGGIEIPDLALLPPPEGAEATAADDAAEDPEADQVVSVDTVPAEEIQED